MRRAGTGRIEIQLVGLWAFVCGFLLIIGAGAFGANGNGEMPEGIDEKEWDRLRRSTAWQEVPDFLSPEAMAGLRDDLLESVRADFAERGRIQVQSDRYLDYDEIRNIIYSNARTRIRFENYILEADRILVHVPLQEIQAEGNVIMRSWSDPAMTVKSQEIHCESMVFNYKYFEGAAYNVRGQHGALHFKTLRKEGELPSFNIVSRDQAVLRDVEFTTCDFPDPQYSLRTRDAILVFDDRLFVQRATLYVRHIPVFWLPAYSKSLHEKFPWHVTFGNSSSMGTYVNVFYNFWHYRYEPSMEDENETVARDRGHATAMVSLMQDRGIGAGLTYSYGFNFDKHQGMISAFGMPSDDEREVIGDDDEDEDDSRWVFYGHHRSELRKNLMLQLGVDYMSDPEVYYDVIDPRRELERRRVPERNARAALTYWKDDFVARALFEVKERITRDRITNTMSPGDDDRDYDPLPDDLSFDWDDDFDDVGTPSSRYGTVSARLPHLTFGTSMLRIGGRSPLMYTVDVNAFNNLDKGLNFNDSGDDSYVLGFDLYQQLSYLFKFSERYTLLAQIGAGMGVMSRADDSYDWTEEDFLIRDVNGNLIARPDIEFVNDNTYYHTGIDDEVSLDDYQEGFVYGDARLRFQGRFTDSLTGNVYYIFREGTDDSLSEHYESIGNKTARADLYNYRIRKHWLEADLVHQLVYPIVTSRIAAGRNLQSNSDIYANEKIQYVTANSEYQNQKRTFRGNVYASYDQFQVRDPRDVNEYKRDSLTVGTRMAYAPVHKRWWFEGNAYIWKALTDDPVQKERDELIDDLEDQLGQSYYNDDFNDGSYYWREDDTDIIIEGWIGRRFGEKWTVELNAEYQQLYDGIRNARLILTRDLHNALAQVTVRYRRRPWQVDDEQEYDIEFGITFKMPGPMDAAQAPRARTLMDQQRVLAIEEGLL